MGSVKPKGWYPDPSGQPKKFRWWDGTQWTEALTETLWASEPRHAPPVAHIDARPGGNPASANALGDAMTRGGPASPPAVVEIDDDQPGSRRGLLIGVLVSVMILLAAAATYLVLSNRSPSNPTASGPSTSPSAQTSPTATPAPSLSPSANPPPSLTPPTDVPNVLDTDSATFEGSAGQWNEWYSAAIAPNAAGAHGGTNSLEIKATGSDGWGVILDNYPGFDITPGDKLIRVWARRGTGAAIEPKLTLKWLNAHQKTIHTDVVPFPALTASWREATAKLTAPAGTTTVLVTLTGSGSTGTTLYVDDISIGAKP